MTETSSAATLGELIRLNRRFGVLVSMGATPHAALQAVKPEASPVFTQLIDHIADRLNAGGTLSDALGDFPDLVPAIFRDWVRIGEETGTIDVGAQEIADLLDPLTTGDVTISWEHIEDAVSLIQFTRRCAELLEKGLEWWRVIYLLLHEAPPAFAHFIEELLPKRDDCNGLLKLWQRMDELPHIFSPFYRAMVRLGLEMRAMDEMMRSLADLLYEDWSLARRSGCFTDRASLIINHGANPAENWDELTTAQKQLTTVIFCHAASQLLSCGYDARDMLSTCALLLPIEQQQRLRESSGDDIVDALNTLGCFSPFVITLLECGQVRGRMEFAFNQAATVLRAEMK
ncbi:MAG: type II secretion system F family protein [Armatimonadota bacterium]